MKLVHLIAAARPNFMKVAPLYHALAASGDFTPVLVHTGQHYDPNMSDAFFRDLGLPDPHHHLGVGSGSHAEQTGGVMIAYEKVAMAQRPDWLIVVGDVNSTAACAMVGAKLGIPTVHLEAGLRSRDVIVAVDGAPVRNSDELRDALLKHRIGDTIRLSVQRGEEKLEVQVVAGRHPQARNR